LTTTFSGSVLKLYCDGVLLAQRNADLDINTAELSIGTIGSWNSERDFSGCIYEVSIFAYEKLAGEIAQQIIPDNLCGSNGNNLSPELSRMFTGSPCACAGACDLYASCAGWSYIPNGLHGMGTDDCVFKSSFGIDVTVDDCGGRCWSGGRSTAAGRRSLSNLPTIFRKVQILMKTNRS